MSGKRFYIPAKLYKRLDRIAKMKGLTVDQYATELLNKVVAREVQGTD